MSKSPNEQINESRESLDFALQSGRMGTWDILLETGDIYCSQEMLDLWSVTLEEFQNQRTILQSKVHPLDLQKMISAINHAIQTHTLYELEYRIIPTPGDVRWVFSRGRCTFTQDSTKPKRFSGIVFDITEKKLNEEALLSASRARDQLFMVASHELKTPLTCLALQFQVMEWDLGHRSTHPISFTKLEDNLKKQQEHLARISRIIDNICDESIINEGRLNLQFEEFDLSEMVHDVLQQFEMTARLAEMKVHFLKEEKVLGNWDRFRLEQVLLNLLMNAIRYGNRKPIVVEVKKVESFAKLIVRDQGIGIKQEDQNRIFNRFERVNSDQKVSGMGLGLFISNTIVRDHGGKIELESVIEKGSTFTVLLPTILNK
jgi:signal transduction histidine kinase